MLQIHSPFLSCGELCDADLFLPDGVELPPVIIIAHGLGHPRFIANMRYARGLVLNGYAVFLFDYRNYGFSEGEIRNLTDPLCQMDDIRAAIAHLRSLAMIDNTRIVLCGISLAGGYPLTIAAEDHDIAAVVCMIPVMSPKVSLKKKKKTAALPYIILTSYDAILGFIGLKPFCIPMFVSRSHLNDFTDSVYYPGYTFDCSQIHGKRVVHHIAIQNILTGQSVVWVNLVPFRSLKKILAYEAISALPKVQCPILVIAAKNDPVVPYSMLKSMMEPYSNVEFFTYEGNHYNVTDKWVCDEMITEILKLLTGLFDKPASENSTCFDIESEKRIVEIK